MDIIETFGQAQGKTMDAQTLARQLNAFLKIDEFSDYGPNGLQVEGQRPVQTCATAVSANLKTIEAAIEAGVDALIVHHGLFWQGDSLVVEGPKRAKLHALLESGISLLAYHLPLDAHPEVGNNWVAARELGWNDLEAFDIGVRGTFAPLPVEAFLAELEAFYGHRAVFAMGGGQTVQSAALISGGAWRRVSAAAKLGVDCFITGNFDEPAWAMAHEENIHFFALGHSATERVGQRALAKHLEESLKVPCQFLDIENPF